MEVARFFRNVENFPLPQSAKISKQDRYWWNDTDSRNRSTRRKTYPRVLYESHMDWHGIEPKSPR